MKLVLLFCLAATATLLGQDRPPSAAPTTRTPTGGRTITRNLVFGVADTTVVSDDSERYLRNAITVGEPLPAFDTTVTEPPTALGSGVIVARAGYVLTAAHVIEGAPRIEVVTTHGKLAATLVASDRDTDLAILKLPDDTYPALALAPYWTVRVGRRVAAIGFPQPDLPHVQPWLVRGEITAAKDEWGNAGHWKLDFATARGASGAAVIDEAGFVVGIVQRAVLAWPVQGGDARPAITTTAVKSGYAWPLLEYAAPASPFLPEMPGGRSFDEVVATAREAMVLVLRYDKGAQPEHP